MRTFVHTLHGGVIGDVGQVQRLANLICDQQPHFHGAVPEVEGDPQPHARRHLGHGDMMRTVRMRSAWQRRLGQVIGDTRNVARTAFSRVHRPLLPHLINGCNRATYQSNVEIPYYFVSYVFLLDELAGTLQASDPNEQVDEFRTIPPAELVNLAQQLRQLSDTSEPAIRGKWASWGRFRAVMHEECAAWMDDDKLGLLGCNDRINRDARTDG